MKSLRLNLPRLVLVFLCLMILSVGLTACGGGSSEESSNDNDNDSKETGRLVVSLTDGEGDFSNYTVDVTGLTLTKANGTKVPVLPMSARVDFAQYTDMTEFLTADDVPAGSYVSATMTLDYRDADIWVENDEGDLVEVKYFEDEDGDRITTLKVDVQLQGRNQLVIAPGIPQHLTLDFDLAATNTVTFDDDDEATVAVDPYLIAHINREGGYKFNRLRGRLDDVDTNDSSFTVEIKPFFCPINGDNCNFGNMTVSIDRDTQFDLNGESYEGDEGLEAMEDLDSPVAVVATGEVRYNPLRFEAEQVYAGTSTPWKDQTIVSGSVVARDGDTLTVKGATAEFSDGKIVFYKKVAVTVGNDTQVTRQWSTERYNIDDISVGQAVMVSGDLTNDDPKNLKLDATDGYVRLLMTIVRGTVVDTDRNDSTVQLSVDLQSINFRYVKIFDFTGTGENSYDDADPNNYEINIGDLGLSGLNDGDPVKVLGFVQPFGEAPQDFNAETIIDVMDDKNAFLKVRWNPENVNNEDPLDSITSDRLVLNIEDSTLFHHVYRAWVVTDLTDTTNIPSPKVVPKDKDNGLFILYYGRKWQVLTTFKEYTDTLQDLLDDGWQVKKIWAWGEYNDDTATIDAGLVDIRLK